MRLANLRIMTAKHNYDTEELNTGCTGTNLRSCHAKEEPMWIFKWEQLREVKGFLASRCVFYVCTVKAEFQDSLISSDVKINSFEESLHECEKEPNHWNQITSNAAAKISWKLSAIICVCLTFNKEMSAVNIQYRIYDGIYHFPRRLTKVILCMNAPRVLKGALLLGISFLLLEIKPVNGSCQRAFITTRCQIEAKLKLNRSQAKVSLLSYAFTSVLWLIDGVTVNLKANTLTELIAVCAPRWSNCLCVFRRRREKLQAHLKESRSLKNYTTSSHNAQDAKTRASNTNLQIHEVQTRVFFPLKVRNMHVSAGGTHLFPSREDY